MPNRLFRLLAYSLVAASSACTFFDPLSQDGLRIAMVPADTAVTIGGSVLLSGLMVNQYGDVYPSEHIEYRSLDPALAVSGRGVATASVVGRFGVVAHRGDLADTGWVSVVPPGTLALSSISDQSAVVVVRTDGSGVARVVGSGQFGGGAAAWLPGDAGLVYQYAVPGGAGAGHLFVTDFAGNSHPLLVDPTGEKDSHFARVSRDGQWVYFRYGVGGGEIWRVHPDGAALEQVTGPLPFNTGDTDPDPSPNGRFLAFTTNRFDQPGFELAVRDLADGTERPLGLAGLLPRWAPDGQRLAYWAGDEFGGHGGIYVAQADGSGAHQVSASGRDYIAQGLDWSPDGEWLVAQTADGIDLIQVSTGVTLPLPYSAGYWRASWRW